MTSKNKEQTEVTDQERAAIHDRIMNGEPVNDETGEVGESTDAPIGPIFNADGSVVDTDPEWDSVEGGVQMEFEDDGDFIQGIVTGVGGAEVTNNNGDPQTLGKYTVMVQKGVSRGKPLTNGELYTVIGTYAIDESLRGAPDANGAYPNMIKVNSIVLIKFEGWIDTSNRNRFRQFTIKKAYPKTRPATTQT